MKRMRTVDFDAFAFPRQRAEQLLDEGLLRQAIRLLRMMDHEQVRRNLRYVEELKKEAK